MAKTLAVATAGTKTTPSSSAAVAVICSSSLACASTLSCSDQGAVVNAASSGSLTMVAA